MLTQKNTTMLYILLVHPNIRNRLYVKVGIAKNIKTRVSDLQTGCPFKIEPLICCQISQVGARKKESDLHKLLWRHKSNGEWFILNDASEGIIQEYFLNLLREGWPHCIYRMRKTYNRHKELCLDDNDYINHPEIKINNLTGGPRDFQQTRPDFNIWRSETPRSVPSWEIFGDFELKTHHYRSDTYLKPID